MTEPISDPEVIKDIYQLEKDYIEFVEKCKQGGTKLDLSRWIPKFRVCRPLVPGELFVVMARTKHGKSAILQNIARTAAPLKVLYFSLELPGTLMYERTAAMHVGKGQVEIEQFYTDGHMLDTEELMSMGHIYTCELSRLTPSQIVDVIHLFKKRVGQSPELVIIDYTGLLNSEVNKSRYERTSDAIQELKRIARDEDVIIGCACQVTVGKDEDPELYIGCSRDSKDIENSAGLTIGAWRDPSDKNVLWTKILLQTKGSSGDKWPNTFDGEKMLITPQEPDWAHQGEL